MASSEVAPPESSSKPKSQNKTRKRAPKACLSCRARKVRCDVSQRGRPCMNCYLDSEACVVTGRASRFRRAQQRDDAANTDNAEASFPPFGLEAAGEQRSHDIDSITAATRNHDVSMSLTEEPQGQHPQTHTHSRSRSHYSHDDHSSPLLTGNDRKKTTPAAAAQKRSCHGERHAGGGHGGHHSKPPAATATPSFETMLANSLPLNGSVSSSQVSNNDATTTHLNLDVTYSFYPFLALGNLHNIPPQDVNFLELQGCLRIPTRTILDEFVQQYFLHVHPLLPMLNEGDFWDVYCTSPVGFSTDRLSLLLFQAMLFASCNFVSRHTIKTLGFPTIRAARAAFYRRAKLLHDLESESSPLAISQAALLLSFWSPPSSPALRKSNTAWLTIAIQNAKTVEAHHYATRTAPPKKRNLLKRLWWSCIIRDRIVGLGMRRGVQITRSHFDFDANGILGYSDLSDEIERSRVYNPGTKRCLAEILEQLVELCVVLTDILILVFPLDDSPGWGREMRAEEQDRVRGCKMALRRWYKGATLRFPMFGGGSVARMKSPGNEFQHDSVILYTNLMYMYYHSSRVVLSHHEVLHLAITAAAPSFSAIPTSDLVIIGENRHELQDAASGVTECLKELIHLRLARWLPISAVACTALPLVLHILDVKLSAASRSFDPNTQSALKQHRLNILIEAMKTYQPQYDGVDWVSETIRHIVNLAQLDSPVAGGEPAAAPHHPHAAANNEGGAGGAGAGAAVIADWTDILASQPSSYLRLALTMDLSLSKGRLPEDGDFPVSLRGLFTGGFNPIKMLLERKRAERRGCSGAGSGAFGVGLSSSPASAPMTTMMMMEDFENGTVRPNLFHRMQPGTVTAIPSDEDTNSPASAAASGGGSDHINSQDSSMTDETFQSPHTGAAASAAEYQQEKDDEDVGMVAAATTVDRPASEGIDGLAAEVLGAFPLDDSSPVSMDGDFDGMYFDGMPGHDGPHGWIETAWGDLTHGEDKSDRDTARVLLEALGEGELAECAA